MDFLDDKLPLPLLISLHTVLQYVLQKMDQTHRYQQRLSHILYPDNRFINSNIPHSWLEFIIVLLIQPDIMNRSLISNKQNLKLQEHL